MDSIEYQVLNTMKMLQTAYFEHSKPEELLPMLSDKVIWAGPGRAEVYDGAEAVREMMAREKTTGHEVLEIRNSSYGTRKISETDWAVYGTGTFLMNAPNTVHLNLKIQLSAVCSIIGEEIKINLVHVSLPGYEQNFLANHIPGGVLCCSNDDKYIISFISDGFFQMFGYSQKDVENLFQNQYINMIYFDDRENIRKTIQEQLKQGDTIEAEYRVMTKSGKLIWIMEKDRVISTCDGDFFYCILLDVTKNKKASEELRLSLERHKIIMDQTTDIIFEWDIQEDTVFYSQNWFKKFGYEPLQKCVSQDIRKSIHVYKDDIPEFTRIIEEISKGRHFIETEVRISKVEGNFIWCRIRATTQYNQIGKPVKAVGVIIDIDNEKKQSQKLLDKAERDGLTRLYNKTATRTQIETFLEACHTSILNALFIIDIDNFKQVNDTMGHLFGDAVLTDVSSAMQNFFRGTDVIGRVGGDEFLVFMKNIPDVEFLKKKADKLLKMFWNLFARERKNYKISCSIGIVIHPTDGISYQQLFQNADIALYQAKKQGKNQFVLYDRSLITDQTIPIYKGIRSSINEKIDSEQDSKVLSSQLVEYIFKILYKAEDTETAVNLILEIVGRQFDVSRAYIFENSADDNFCINTFEWCNIGIEPEIENLQMQSYVKDMVDYRDNFNENGIFYCRDISMLPSSQYEVLEPQGIKALLQCAIWDNGAMKGYVGFDECRTNRFWTKDQIDVLTFVSEVLSIFLMKKRAQDRGTETTRALKAILDSQNSWIYVVSENDYRLLYVNEKTKETFPKAEVDLKCYEVLEGRKSPCEKCPAREALLKGSGSSVEMYNRLLSQWFLVDLSTIEWMGEKAYLVCCHDISQYKDQLNK